MPYKMPSKYTKILEFNQYQKPVKSLFINYVDLECLIGKFDGCKNNPENSSTAKVSEHVPSGFVMSTISSFKRTENKHNIKRGKDGIKKFCEPLREHAVEIINFKKKRNEANNKRTAEIISKCKMQNAKKKKN